MANSSYIGGGLLAKVHGFIQRTATRIWYRPRRFGLGMVSTSLLVLGWKYPPASQTAPNDEGVFVYVYDANYAKFSQHKDLKEQLLETGDKIIVEASPYDLIWGVGLGENNRIYSKEATGNEASLLW